ncbi:hypothetical protein AVEN_228226-1 [Araneus ventricosus]|uniref:Endonuclease/exonuclease/phosphatase domain-containing protein n=1 Tax=Araneus ventricosus TaxID=182803 RepID=A0A4Y2DCA5_ARAVE|nr:hypothetical protein AVEN_228226-1 [Araneus ventricosus]
MFTLLSWNCRGVRNKIQDLKALLNFSQPVCVALQETFLKSNLNFKLRGYNCVRKDSVTTPSGGVCPLRGTSSLGVTGFTTPRYPSVCSPFELCLLFEFHLFSSVPRG